MSEIRLPYFEVNEEFSSLTFEKVGWHIDKLNIERVHQITRGEGVRIGVIDTAFHTDNPELQRRVIEYIDVTGEGLSAPQRVIHGTHVASTICGWVNMVGVAPDAEIIAIKALRNSGGGTGKDVADAILLAYNKGCQIISLSLGSDSLSRDMKNAIDFVTEKGALVVCAAGNDGQKIDYPAALPNTIGVAALGYSDNWFVADFSSPGTDEHEVNIAAPGVDIVAAANSTQYKSLRGTSMACPIVSGVLALLLSVQGTKSFEEGLRLFESTALKLDNFHPRRVGAGIVNPVQMLDNGEIVEAPEKECPKIHPALAWINKLLLKKPA